jgi:hypothetical protein
VKTSAHLPVVWLPNDSSARETSVDIPARRTTSSHAEGTNKVRKYDTFESTKVKYESTFVLSYESTFEDSVCTFIHNYSTCIHNYTSTKVLSYNDTTTCNDTVRKYFSTFEDSVPSYTQLQYMHTQLHIYEGTMIQPRVTIQYESTSVLLTYWIQA